MNAVVNQIATVVAKENVSLLSFPSNDVILSELKQEERKE